MYDSSNTYATVAQVEKRLTSRGRLDAVDVDYPDGDEDAVESMYLEEAIEWANQLIDEALTPHVELTPRPSNQWLTDRCIDLACYRVQTLGGREADKPFADAYELAIDKLGDVFRRDIDVPGLDYTRTLSSGRRSPQVMRAINVRC